MREQMPLNPASEDGAREIENLIAEYLDRLNDGETLDPKAILAGHPGVGHEVVRALHGFVDSGFEDDADPLLGTLGDYSLRRQIGRGGMGVVYEAWQNSLDRHVALKVLPPGIAADARSSTRFLREAQIAAKLTHRNIVPVFASGVEGDTPY